MKILNAIHWSIPWVILILGMTTIYRFARSHMAEQPFTDADRKQVVWFGRLMDLQGGIGLIYFFWAAFSGEGYPTYRILHAIIMFIATAIPHYFTRRERTLDSSLHLHYFYMLLDCFLVMLVGISLIPA